MVRSRERGGVGVMMSSKLDTRTVKGSHLASVHVHLHNLTDSRSLMIFSYSRSRYSSSTRNVPSGSIEVGNHRPSITNTKLLFMFTTSPPPQSQPAISPSHPLRISHIPSQPFIWRLQSSNLDSQMYSSLLVYPFLVCRWVIEFGVNFVGLRLLDH
jgi:hypothetical protein